MTAFIILYVSLGITALSLIEIAYRRKWCKRGAEQMKGKELFAVVFFWPASVPVILCMVAYKLVQKALEATKPAEDYSDGIDAPHFRARHSGFTLMELLIVISVILVLVGLGVTLGPAIAGRGGEMATRSTLSVAESVVTEYHALTGRQPTVAPDYAVDRNTFPRSGEWVANDTYPTNQIGTVSDLITLPIESREQMEEHSIERFISQTLQTTIVSRDDPRTMLRNRNSINSMYESVDGLGDEDDNGFIELRDGWGNKIVHVMPYREVTTYNGGGSQRVVAAPYYPYAPNATDHLPQQRTPYFASAGPDGDFGDVTADEGTPAFEATRDNLYSYEVGD